MQGAIAKALLVLLASLRLALLPTATPAYLAGPQSTPPGRTPVQTRETSLGLLVKAELRKVARITIPDPPSAPVVEGRSTPSNRPVAAGKGTVLLVLHFELRPNQIVRLDHSQIVLKDANDKSYSFGGWYVEEAEYQMGFAPASMVRGPWGNIFWSPTVVRPKYGSIDLVFQVDEKAGKLRLSDGRIEIELDPSPIPK